MTMIDIFVSCLGKEKQNELKLNDSKLRQFVWKGIDVYGLKHFKLVVEYLVALC